jgi:stearoyl-CoA desaturase (delta-9 desaturase)
VPQALLALLVGLAVCQIAIFCTTVFLHRTVAHKALSVSPGVRFAFRFLVWITTGIRPRQWAAVHRRHHAYTDVEGDPHSPLLLGFWKVQLANALLYRKVARDGENTRRYAKDLPPDRWDTVLFDHALLGLGIGIAILCVSLGWEWGLVASAVHTVTYLLLNGAITALAHVTGTQPYPTTARHNQWLAWLTAGEGLHNNHHAVATASKLAMAPREFDPGWWVIRMLVLTRQAKLRVSVADRPPANAPA